MMRYCEGTTFGQIRYSIMVWDDSAKQRAALGGGSSALLLDDVLLAKASGAIIETADAGKIIKARIEAYREEKQPGGSRPPFFQVVAIEI